MTTYTPATVAKALVAFGVTTVSTAGGLAHGVDLSVLDFGQWLIALGAGLTAGGGVFGTPNKDHKPAPEQPSPVDQVIAALPAVVQNAASANADLQKVTQAATDVLGLGDDLVGKVEQAIANATKR
ncbi:hypothetical protein [Mycolicibacterium helvum]|uniref:Holin n=1 Tax=Mycolicibacterium helvum TaxID=1534349 RepID=A0A7I7T3P4_9MYCO|nr:hypothetical protein [Mycolicibacterium helvum]BBY63121.1 hypothetical protein MHEL_13640 [Mycolicibacterium helvum]